MSDETTTSAPERPDAAVMRGVIPYLGLRGRAGEAADFYGKALAATELGRFPDAEKPDQLMHVQVEINGGCLMMTDHAADCDTAPGVLQGAHLQLVVDDGQGWWSRAIAAGCKEIMPYERQSWGDDWGMLEDPFGIRWGILQPGPEPTG